MTMAPSSGSDEPDPLIAAFCEALWLEDGLSRNTLAAYRRDLEHLDVWMNSNQRGALAGVSQQDLQDYIALRHPQSRATSSNRRLSVFRRLGRFLVRQGQRSDDPTACCPSTAAIPQDAVRITSRSAAAGAGCADRPGAA
jgi:integrase/recombinase XerD